MSVELPRTLNDAMGRLSNSGIESVDDLLQHLSELKKQDRIIGTWALGQLRDRRTVGTLLQMLQDQYVEVRMEAASALAVVGGERALKALKDAATGAEDRDTRKAAVYGLAFMFVDEALGPLIHVLNDAREHPAIRGVAAEGIGNIMEDANSDTLRFRRVGNTLINCLDDNSPEVRFWAVFALGAMKDVRAVRYLFRLAKNDHAVCPDYGSVSKEALNSIQRIYGVED